MKKRFKAISRKMFFKQLAFFLSVPYVYLAMKTILKQRETQGIREIRLPLEMGKDVMFFQQVIYINSPKGVLFLSSKCTHLGCKINSLKSNELACACHGSHFSLEGKVLNGPAATPLPKLDYSIDNETQEYIVKLS